MLRAFKYSAVLFMLCILAGCTTSKTYRVQGRDRSFARGRSSSGSRISKRDPLPEYTRSRRTRLRGRGETQHQQIIPARREYFKGNPHLLHSNPQR